MGKFANRIRGVWTRTKSADATDSTSHQTHDLNRPANSLERELSAWQIYMIAISGIIGVTILATNGEYLRTAGPAGLLASITVVGATAVCVMEGLSEMVVLWPVSNAMVEYVKAFVDKELALVVGFAYWYTWSSVIATMFIAAAQFGAYWGLVNTWQIIIFYFICPATIGAINWLGVKWYGYVEGIAGILKLLWVIGGAFYLFGVGAKYGSLNINDGFRDDRNVADSHITAFILVIPFLSYGFLGVEIVSVTAFEAKSPRTALRSPSKFIAYIIVALFFLCGIGEALNLPWNAAGLSELSDAKMKKRADLTIDNTAGLKHTSSVLVLAAERAGDMGLAGFFNACLIYSCLSAANTALYVSSRTLYGLCREVDPDDSRIMYRLAAKLGALDPRTRVPIWSIVVSVLAFFWVPFLHVWNRNSVADLITILTTTGSIGGVLVWASQCLAYIRYHNWCRVHKFTIKSLMRSNTRYARYYRWDNNNKKHYLSVWGPTQPVPALLGLISCFLIVFVFSTATWWDHSVTAKKVAVAFAGPVVLLLFWVTLKLLRRPGEWWVKLDDRAANFQTVIGNLERLTYLRDVDEDENELGHVRTRRDNESQPQDIAPAATGTSGALDMPEIGAQLFTPATPPPNGISIRTSRDTGIDTLRRRGTGESEKAEIAPH